MKGGSPKERRAASDQSVSSSIDYRLVAVVFLT